MKIFFLILTLLGLSLSSYAYVPSLELILQQMTKNNGRGLYLIDQDVVIPANPFPYVVHEQWLIENENKMRVRITGKKELKGLLDMTIIYSYNKKYTINESLKKVSSPLSPFFIERFFHFRKPVFVKRQLAAQAILPKSSVRALSKESVTHSLSPYMRLARLSGVVTYFIGNPSVNGEGKNPGLWVEQDQFVLRKLRYSDGTELIAEQHQRHSRGIKTPQKRTLTWGEKTVYINTNRVRPASSSAINRRRLSHLSLNVKKEPHLARKVPDVEVVKEFYSRFR